MPGARFTWIRIQSFAALYVMVTSSSMASGLWVVPRSASARPAASCGVTTYFAPVLR